MEGKEAVLFSCSHVMPKENLITFSISNGPSNVPFNFSYKNRGNSKVMEEVGNFIVNICNIVPDGMVIFLPSYQYMDLIVQHWKKSSVFQRISAKKKVLHFSFHLRPLHHTNDINGFPFLPFPLPFPLDFCGT